MQIIELALVLLLITAIGGALVRWTSLGLPIFLVVVGAVASFIPGLDHMAIDPEVFLLLFIPPLLFADARVLPRRDLLHVLKPVLLLALGLVVLTVIVVGYVIHWLVPALRRQIEQPKYTFQEQLQHFDEQHFDKQRQDAQAKVSDQATGSDKERTNETR